MLRRLVTAYALVYMLTHFHRVSVGPITGSIMESFSATASEVGAVVSATFIATAFVQVPSGTFIDLYGPRRFVIITFPSMILGSFLFAVAPTISVSILARVLIGIGGGALFIAGTAALASELPAHQYPRSLGLYLGISFAGSVIGALIPGLVVDAGIAWRALYIATGIVSILFFLAFITMAHYDRYPPARSGRRMLNIPLKRDILLTGLVVMLYEGPMFALFTWTPKFLSDTYGWTKGAASSILTVVMVTMIISLMVLGHRISSIRSSKKIFTAGCLGTSAMLALLSYSAYLGSLYLSLLTIMVTGFTVGGTIGWTVFARDWTNVNLGSVFGLINGFVFLGGFINPFLFGIILDYVGPVIVSGERIYPSWSYTLGFISASGAALVGSLISVYQHHLRKSRHK